MSESQDPQIHLPDPEKVNQTMAKIAEQSQRVVQEFIERQSSGEGGYNVLDPTVVGHAFQELTAKMMSDPAKLVESQMKLWQGYVELWQNTARRMMGEEAEPVATPAPTDKRFKDDEWQENPVFDYIKQSYLLASEFMLDSVRNVEGLDPKTAEKVDFYTRQYVDAMAPTNFAMTNPQVIRRTIETGGENLLQGLSN
ncbi:MAG: class I poly(R)-hydroxyalkanoic acid synthase, partial [Gammaproteobacteria bacterium]|nr:class I poly(R)-hydroxyalkanoic acid synthase [Gammaproteobacteria bacterium]